MSQSKQSEPESIESEPIEPFQNRIGEPPILEFPDGWTSSTSWNRANRERDHGGPGEHPHVRFVFLEDSSDPRRVVFVLDGCRIRAECPCDGFHYRGWCAHVASLWWQWCRGRILVRHMQSGRDHRLPPGWIRFGGDPDDDPDLSGLSPKQLDAFLHCELGDFGVREFARHRSKAPGTVGNQLREARQRAETPHPHAGVGSR
jgi:hypothetical protein